MRSTKKLSAAQQRFLERVRANGEKGYRTPFTGGRNAGRVASAWYRTAQSLKDAGLITLEREGDAYRAFATEGQKRTARLAQEAQNRAVDLSAAIAEGAATPEARERLATRLQACEANGDHHHGGGPIPTGGACPGGCIVSEARRLLLNAAAPKMLAALEDMLRALADGDPAQALDILRADGNRAVEAAGGDAP